MAVPLSSSGGKETVVGLSSMDRLLRMIGMSTVGLGLGYALPRVAAYAMTLPWAPFEGPLRLIASFHGVWVDMAAGALVGLIAAWFDAA